MLTYFAILHKNHSGYVVTFPDFPTCRVPGESFEEAYKSAAAVLRTHVREMAERGEPLPEPCDRDAINEIPNADQGLLLRVDVEASPRTQTGPDG